jgi:ABC-type nitrate/sulfonate/bicarbonate transport system substrate-binding protein
VNQPADLRGRRVALNPSSSPGYFMEKLLGQVGLALADITVVDLLEGPSLPRRSGTGRSTRRSSWSRG